MGSRCSIVPLQREIPTEIHGEELEDELEGDHGEQSKHGEVLQDLVCFFTMHLEHSLMLMMLVIFFAEGNGNADSSIKKKDERV